MSFTPQRLSGRLCKNARGLLKWNIHDLSSRVGIPSKYLANFELGTQYLVPSEMQALIRVFEQEGVVFHPDSHLTLVNRFERMMEERRRRSREQEIAAMTKKYQENSTKKPQLEPDGQ